LTSNKTQDINRDFHNALYVLKNVIEGINVKITTISNPISSVSESARAYLDYHQIMAIQKSFLTRTALILNHINNVQKQLSKISNQHELIMMCSIIEKLRNEYFLLEQVYDYYVHLINTRSEFGMGPLLKGCDKIAHESLKVGLKGLGYPIPPVACHLQYGPGLHIIKHGINLWDGNKNPVAIIKIERIGFPSPRITAVIHECGHQFWHITNGLQELKNLIYSVVFKETGDKELSQKWSDWTSEIGADILALKQANFAAVVGLAEVTISNPQNMFRFIPGDPHPNMILRIMMGIETVKLGYGNGDWDIFRNTWDFLYPQELADNISKGLINDSLPIIPKLCAAICETKMECFKQKSLNDLIPWNYFSPTVIKNFLKKDASDFNMDISDLQTNPIAQLSCFRIMQMFGGRTRSSIRDQMCNWLLSLAS